MISQYVLADHSDKYLVRVIDRVKVKGKSKPLMCYELLAAHDNATDRQKNIAETFATGFELYSKGDYKKALSAIEKCLPFEEPSFQGATNPSLIYIDRCKGLIENPPVEWDGIASLDRK